MDANEFDTDLIERVKSGDVLAFTEIDRKWRPILFGLFSRKTRNVSDSEDLVQLTLLHVWEKRQLFSREAGTFASWVHRIANNLLIDTVRSSKRQIRGNGVEHVEINPEITEQVTESNNAVLEHEVSDVLREVIGSLPRRLRKPAEGYLLQQSQQRTADLQGLSTLKVRDRLKCAFTRMRDDVRLRQLVGEEIDEYSTGFAYSQPVSDVKVQLSLFED